MSHLFISYKREDQYQLKALIRKLEENNIPYWYDKAIGTGDEWRQSIDDALENAFALVVIVTAKSLKSPYVTYEWSWALGAGIKVIPLKFEDVAEDAVHPRLSVIQLENCIEEISTTIIHNIIKLYKIPYVTQYSEIAINDLLRPLRYYIFFASWLYRYSQQGTIYPQAGAYELALATIIFEYQRLSAHGFLNFWLNIGNNFPRNLKDIAESLTQSTLLTLGRSYIESEKPTLDMLKLEKEWNSRIEPILINLHGYSNFEQIEQLLNSVPQDSEKVWEVKTRNIFLSLSDKGLRMFIDSNDQLRLDNTVVNAVGHIFSSLYMHSDPEQHQQLDTDFGTSGINDNATFTDDEEF